jgi:hypothetical protein
MLDPQKTQIESIPVIFSQSKEYFHHHTMNTGTLEHWHIGTLAHWNTGTLEHWNTETLEH